jgi:hypothetical protein
MAKSISSLVEVSVLVVASVDAEDEDLSEAVRDSRGDRTIADVVRDEIKSNLESVSYVRHVAIMTKSKGGEP